MQMRQGTGKGFLAPDLTILNEVVRGWLQDALILELATG